MCGFRALSTEATERYPERQRKATHTWEPAPADRPTVIGDEPTCVIRTGAVLRRSFNRAAW
jgi:hypothetical protein